MRNYYEDNNIISNRIIIDSDIIKQAKMVTVTCVISSLVGSISAIIGSMI